MIILKSIESIMSIILMISLGYYLAHKKWFNEEKSQLLVKIVTHIALPSYMIQNLTTTFDSEKLSKLSGGLLVPILSMLICYFIGLLISKLIKVPEGRKGTFKTMFFVSNSIFIGLPVNLALFGENSVPFVLLYYIANTCFFWTIGAYSIAKDGDGKNIKLFSMEAVRKIFSPPLIGFLVGILLVMIDIHLPSFIVETLKYMGSMTTPLSMIFIGITIYSVSFRKIKFTKDMSFILVGRFIISPLIVIILIRYIKLPIMMSSVFIIQSTMPVMTQTSIIAKSYNSDYEYAAVMTAITTIVSIVSIPIYMNLLSILLK